MLIGSWKSNPTSSGYVVSENIDTFHSHLGVLKRATPLSPLNERTNEWMNEFHTFHSQFGLLFSTQSDETHHLLIISTHFHSHLGRLKAPSDSFLEWLFCQVLLVRSNQCNPKKENWLHFRPNETQKIVTFRPKWNQKFIKKLLLLFFTLSR